MNDWKWAITLAIFCCIDLTIAPSASADFVGVATVIKDDPDTVAQCNSGAGAFNFGFGPISVCNVFAVFDNPDDLLLGVAEADLQVYNGANPDVFFQHVANGTTFSAACSFIVHVPDLICDSFVTIGYKCAPDPAGTDRTALDDDFSVSEFQLNGHIVGGWFNATPTNGQGDAGTWPDLQVLFLQSSVAQGLSLSGVIHIIWEDGDTGDFIIEHDVPIECAAGCPDDYPCDDGDACTENDQCFDGVCIGPPINCDDGNQCTDDGCDPDTGCTHTPNNDPCDDGDACTDGDHCGDDGCVQGGPPVDCDDGDECTDDSCDSETGCVHTDIDCDDGDQCTDDTCDLEDGCTHSPIDCSDRNLCTDDLCDPDTGCTHEDAECSEGQVCNPATGECVVDQDPCECVNGRVTLCHIPPGNRANGRTITVGCAARDKHLAHGDVCGPCKGGDG